MKRGEVNRNARAEMFNEPHRHAIDLVFGIVFSRDKETCDLDPDIGLVVYIEERVQHGLQMRGANSMIEAFAETLQIDVRSVHMLEEVFARL